MNTSLIKTLAGLIAAISASSIALADPINGSVSFFGDASLSGTTLSFNSVTTNQGFGSYAGIASGDVTSFASLAGISLDVTNPNGQAFTVPAGNLWSFYDATTQDTYTFAATTAVQPFGSDVNQEWTFNGQGVASISGPTGSYVDTPGSWNIVTEASGVDTFTFTEGTSVPDSGTTVLLVVLGLAAVGIYAASRKKADLRA